MRPAQTSNTGLDLGEIYRKFCQSVMRRCGDPMERIGAVGLLGLVEIHGVFVKKIRLLFGGETRLLTIQSSGIPQCERHTRLCINTIYASSPLCSQHIVRNRSIHLPRSSNLLQARQRHEHIQISPRTSVPRLRDCKQNIHLTGSLSRSDRVVSLASVWTNSTALSQPEELESARWTKLSPRERKRQRL